MPGGARFPARIVEDYFAAVPPAGQPAPGWGDPITNLKFIGTSPTGIGPRLQQVVTPAQPGIPSIQRVLSWLLRRSRQLYNTGNFGSRPNSLESVLDFAVTNAEPFKCDDDTGYYSRGPNRFAYNVLGELVAYAKRIRGQAGVAQPALPPTAVAFLTALPSATQIQRTIICAFNEGVTGANPLEPAGSQYLCRDRPFNSGGGRPHAKAVRKCPCMDQATCTAGPNAAMCTWTGGRCFPTPPGNGRKGARMRSIADGREYTDFARGGAAAAALVALPPPAPDPIAARLQGPHSVAHHGNRHAFVPN